jgi:hypothetical protein
LAELPRKDYFAALAQRMDTEIHRGYQLFPSNYIALDELEDSNIHADHYTEADKTRFDQYLKGQIDKVNLPNRDEAFLRTTMLTMYANPLKNHMAALRA